MVSESAIRNAAGVLLGATPAGSRVFVFGSQATGRADDRSDVDFLVVEPEVEDRVKEMLRLTEVLRPLRIPADLMVLSSRAFDYWRDTPNSLAYRVTKEGRLFESAT